MQSEQFQLRQEIYALLAALLRQAPTAEQLGWLATVESEGIEQQPMRQAWQALSDSAAHTSVEEVSDEYQALFIGIGRGEVMPFASWHIAGALMEKPLAEIRRDLKALGFERNEQTKEPEDHIAALCEVMAMLESEAQQNAFFNRHLQPWFAGLCKQINQAGSARFYKRVASLLEQFLLLEQTRFAMIPVRESVSRTPEREK